MSRRKVLSWLCLGMAVTVVLPLGGCLKDRVTYRQKLVLEVDTPTGRKHGETVIEIGVSFTRKSLEWLVMPEARGGGSGIRRGEALVLDLGGGKYLFATLRGMTYLADGAISRAGYRFGPPDEIRETLERIRKGEIPRLYELTIDDLPLLVTFEDIRRPETVKRVDPWDLDAAFGCDRDTGPKPWRKQGISVQRWHKQRMALRAAREVTKEMGLSPEAGALLARRKFSYGGRSGDWAKLMKGVVDLALTREEWAALEKRIEASGVSWREVYTWEDRFEDRFRALAAQPPRDTARDCYRIAAAWVEVTDAPVTTGRVEKVLGWLEWKREDFVIHGYKENPLKIINHDGTVKYLSILDFSVKWGE